MVDTLNINRDSLVCTQVHVPYHKQIEYEPPVSTNISVAVLFVIGFIVMMLTRNK